MKRIIISFLFFFAAQASANPATELTSLLMGMTTLRAEYVQTTVDPKFKEEKTVTGNALLSRPNQFRWEIETPYEQVLIADGKRLWIYDADLEQATVQPLQENLKDTPALLLAGDPKAITEHFTVTTEDDGFTHKTYDLIPLDENSLVKGVKMTFTGSTLTRMVLIDNLHQVVTITFSQIKINEKLPASLFKFTPPPGVDVISDNDGR